MMRNASFYHDRIERGKNMRYRWPWAAYREILPTLRRQLGDPEWFVRRELPASARTFRPDLHGAVVRTAAAG